MAGLVKGTLEDTGFVRRIVQGDTAAFEALYDLYAPLVYGQLLEITGDRTMAEELLVETFYRAWAQSASFAEGRAALPRWLLGIARELAGHEAWRRYAGMPVAAVA